MSLILTRNKALFILLPWLIAGCASSGDQFQYYNPDMDSGEIALLNKKVAEIEAKHRESIHLEKIAESALSSHHIVIIRDKEPLHYHANHDGWAIALKGKGDLILGEKKFTIRPGSSVFIPRGIPHKAINRGKEPLAAFVIFTPAYDGKDTVPVAEK